MVMLFFKQGGVMMMGGQALQAGNVAARNDPREMPAQHKRRYVCCSNSHIFTFSLLWIELRAPAEHPPELCST